MGTRTTSVKLEDATYEAWKRTGMRLEQIIKLGLLHTQQTPGYLGRISELETGNEKLQRKVTFLINRVNELERLNA